MKRQTRALVLVLPLFLEIPSLAAENPCPASSAMSEAARLLAPEKLINEVFLPEQRALVAAEARLWLTEALARILEEQSTVLAEENAAASSKTTAGGWSHPLKISPSRNAPETRKATPPPPPTR